MSFFLVAILSFFLPLTFFLSPSFSRASSPHWPQADAAILFAFAVLSLSCLLLILACTTEYAEAARGGQGLYVSVLLARQDSVLFFFPCPEPLALLCLIGHFPNAAGQQADSSLGLHTPLPHLSKFPPPPSPPLLCYSSPPPTSPPPPSLSPTPPPLVSSSSPPWHQQPLSPWMLMPTCHFRNECAPSPSSSSLALTSASPSLLQWVSSYVSVPFLAAPHFSSSPRPWPDQPPTPPPIPPPPPGLPFLQWHSRVNPPNPKPSPPRFFFASMDIQGLNPKPQNSCNPIAAQASTSFQKHMILHAISLVTCDV